MVTTRTDIHKIMAKFSDHFNSTGPVYLSKFLLLQMIIIEALYCCDKQILLQISTSPSCKYNHFAAFYLAWNLKKVA